PPPAQYLVHKSLAASHVAASYWTTTSDVAATSAPINAVGQRRSTPLATGQQRRITVVIGGQRWWSTTVNIAGHRSTAADHGGDRRSTVAVNDGYRWRTTVDCRWTTVDHHQTTGQRWLVNSQRWTWAGSGSGLGRVRHVSATCAHVASTWMLTWIICHMWESNPAPYG
nr:hypothetical protein [Tanacetum cinerariifolium]